MAGRPKSPLVGGVTLGTTEWATRKCIDTQRRGSTPRSITVGGVTLGTTEWATRSGISAYTIKSRLGMGWTPQDAVTVPARKHTRGSL